MTEVQKGPVTRNMTIGDIVADYPAATEVLMSFGLHCVGCHVSGIESLEDGAAGHGMDDEDIDEMVEAVNKAIKEGKTLDEEIANRPLVTLTEPAAEKVKDLANKDGKVGQCLKVFVMPGGCSGFKYGMDFVEKQEDSDIFIEQHGIRILVDKESVDFVKGAVIDYIDTLNDSGFKIDNPNAKRSCGCGSSFS